MVQLQSSSLVYCESLATAILNGLLTRYGSLLELQMPIAKTAIIAAVSHPHYKLRWVPPDQRETVRAAFIQSVSSITTSNSDSSTVVNAISTSTV
jgi:hypothetical protein